MAKFSFFILTCAVSAFAKRPLPTITVLLEFHAHRARVSADGAVVDDVACAADGLRFRTSVFWIILVGLDGFHAHIEDALHVLHGERNFCGLNWKNVVLKV